MTVGLFGRARQCQEYRDEEKRKELLRAAMKHEAYLRTEARKAATLIKTIFNVDAREQAQHYGNEYPLLGGVQIGKIWFEPIGDFSLRAVYVCLNECYKTREVRKKTFMSGAEDEVGALALLADLLQDGCSQCFEISTTPEPSNVVVTTSQGVN